MALTRDSILKGIQPETPVQSLWGQYRNAQSGLRYLNGLDPDAMSDDDNQFVNSLRGALKEQKAQALVGETLAGIQGGMQILNSTQQLAHLGDTADYENSIRNISNIGSSSYDNLNQISDAFNNLQIQPNISYDNIRGANATERIGGITNATAAGATAGMTIGGPWGTAIGGTIGLTAGLLGNMTGNQDARVKEQSMKLQARLATDMAQRNLSQATDTLNARDFRAGLSNVVEKGGKIKRQMDIEEFAARVMKRPRMIESQRPLSIYRRHGEGGTIIKIKR